MTKPCRGPDYDTRAPRIRPPPNSCDTQAHVFGPATRFPYDDMTPLARALIGARLDRVIWGSNWPHPILWKGVMPNDGDLLDQFMDWAGDDSTRKQILVDNPAAFYGFA